MPRIIPLSEIKPVSPAALAEAIPNGRKKAVSITRLAERWHTTERMARNIIYQLRLDNYPVCSDDEEACFYLPETLEELEAFLYRAEYMSAKANAELEAMAGCFETWPQREEEAADPFELLNNKLFDQVESRIKTIDTGEELNRLVQGAVILGTEPVDYPATDGLYIYMRKQGAGYIVLSIDPEEPDGEPSFLSARAWRGSLESLKEEPTD